MSSVKLRIAALRSRTARSSVHFELKEVYIPSGASKLEVQQALSEAAEYGRWELVRSKLYVGGERRVWLRRKALKMSSTL